MPHISRRPVARYAAAIAFLAFAAVVRWLLDPLLGNAFPAAAFFAAVAASAWFGGIGPAVLAAALGYLFVEFRFLDAEGPDVTGIAADTASVVAYGATSAILITMCTAARTGHAQPLDAELLAARQQADVLQVTFASIGDAVITTDAAGNVNYLNPVAQELTGWTEADAAGQPLETVFHIVNETTRERVENPVAKVLQLGQIVGLANHTVLISRDGRERPIDDSAAPIREADGRIRGVVLVFRDISELKRARHAQAWLAAIVASSDDAIVSKSLDGIIQSWNEGAERLFGYKPQEAIGRHISLIIPPERLSEEDQIIARLRTGERVDHFETERARSDGRRVTVSLTISPIRDDSGRIVGASKIARDITAQKEGQRRAEIQDVATRALSESKTLEAAATPILEAVCTGLEWDLGALWHVDPRQHVLRCSAVWHRPGLDVQHFEAVTRGSTFRSGEGLPGRVWSGGKAAWIPDVTRDSNFPRASVAREADLHGAFGFPILLHDEVLGVIEFFSREIRQPDEDLLRMMMAIGVQIGQFIDRTRTEEALVASEERFRQMANAAPVMIWMSGKEKECGWFNQQWLDFVGRPMDEELGYGWAENVHPEDREHCTKTFFAAYEDLQPFTMEYRLKRHDGAYRWILDHGIPLEGTHGEFTGYIGTCIDITERKEYEQRLRATDRRKDEFLATLAHELRNPLAPIRNMLEILKRSDADHELLEKARDTMERQLVHLVRLVDDLLDVSRITQDKLELRKQRVRLGAILHQAVETCQPLAVCEGQTIEVFLPGEEIYLHADPVRLTQVFSNLINNACKYTGEGGHIWVAAERTNGDLTVSVKDDGAGIPPEKLAAVFDMFAQVERPLERMRGGLGIGLTLVRRLVEMHGGSVQARSEGAGRGSEFVVRLPVEETAVQDPPQRLTAVNGAVVPQRILVVDDNIDAATSLATLLRLSGSEVTTAFDGPDALRTAAEFRPDVVLLDLGLPQMNGYEVCGAIREQPWGAGMMIIALTGWGQDEDRSRTSAAGFNAHLVKPVDFGVLMDLLTKMRPMPESSGELAGG